MRTKIIYFWELLKGSFWFIPLVIVFAGMLLAFTLIYIDSTVTFQPKGFLLYIMAGGPESARSVLSTIAAAMFGMASTVFSITLVVLTLASSQFGPRLLRNFMYDRLNQVVLGTFVTTFVYCLIVLKSVKSEVDIDFVPVFSILFAEVLSIGNTILLIIFIHHVSVSIQADKVISEISSKLNDNIDEVFPKEFGESKKAGQSLFKDLKILYPVKQVTVNDKSGYLQVMDSDSIMNIAKEFDLLLEIHYRPGDFLVKDLALFHLYAQKEVDENIIDNLKDAFIIGSVRNPSQDPKFAIQQIVEIACRALSPGINDPFTAIACIDNLTNTIGMMTNTNFSAGYRFDDDGQLRVFTKPTTFTELIDAAFNQIRQYGKDSPAVLIRLMEGLHAIHQLAVNKEQKEVIEKHAKMVSHAGEVAFIDEHDLQDLEDCYNRFN